MKDPIDIGTDTVNKAARDGVPIALLRTASGIKKIRASELTPKQELHLIGIYDHDAMPEDVGADIRYVIQRNLCAPI